MCIRLFGSYPEGVSFSILLMNLFTPLLNNMSYKFYLKEGGARNGK
jgi:electron transport complex protein RnfD